MFEALEVTMAMIRQVRDLAQVIGRRDRDLARQLTRAAQSVALNLAEGRKRAGGDRRHLWRIAGGSAEETRVALRVAEAFGYVAPGDLGESLELLDRVVAMTWRMTH